MAGKTLINGTAYTNKGGNVKVNGTGYKIARGKTKIDGTAWTITFRKPIPNNPYIEYLFENVSGSTIIDTSGNNRNGSLGGAVHYDDYIKNPNKLGATVPSLPSALPITFSFWVKPINLTARINMLYMYASYAIMNLMADGSSVWFGDNRTSNNTWFANGVNTHVAMVYTTGSIRLYINGALAWTTSRRTNSSRLTYFCGSSSTSYSDSFCDAELRKFRMYDRELSVDEIQLLATEI